MLVSFEVLVINLYCVYSRERPAKGSRLVVNGRGRVARRAGRSPAVSFSCFALKRAREILPFSCFSPREKPRSQPFNRIAGPAASNQPTVGDKFQKSPKNVKKLCKTSKHIEKRVQQGFGGASARPLQRGFGTVLATYTCRFVRTCVCTYVCPYVCMYIHTYVCVYIHTHLRTYKRTNVSTCVQMYVCTYLRQ